MDAAAPAIATVDVTGTKPAASHFWAGHGFSFHDVLDAINPLQHLPIVSTIYRAITGDQPGNVAELVGDGIYGGLIGLAAGAVNVALKEATGKDIGDTVLSLVEGHSGSATGAAEPAAAARTPAAAPTPDASSAPQAQAGAPPVQTADASSAKPAAPMRGMPLARRFMPIDISDNGIRAMHAVAASHNPKPIPLDLPPGTMLAQPPAAPVDFAAKMREGLDKYGAMIAQHTGDVAGASVDQIH